MALGREDVRGRDNRGSCGRVRLSWPRPVTPFLTRRGFVARGAVAVGALVVPGLARAAKKPKNASVYRLDPRSERCGHAAGSCKTCEKYDKNFLFPSRKAANGNRPHKGCNCCIQQGKLEYGTHVAIFGTPKHRKRYRADRRQAGIKALLKRHPPVFK